MALLGSALLLGGSFWVICASRRVVRPVTLASITNAASPLSSAGCFRITNGYERAILLTDLVVETNSPMGWLAFSHTVPTHPQRLATGETKDLVAGPPTDGTVWRLRVVYGIDVKGPGLWFGKVAYAVSRRRWPGRGFGIMAGSNSCLSSEMRK